MPTFSVVKNVMVSYQVEVEAGSVDEAREKAARGDHKKMIPVRNPDWADDANLAPNQWEAIEKDKSGGLFIGRWPSESLPEPEKPFVRRNCIPAQDGKKHGLELKVSSEYIPPSRDRDDRPPQPQRRMA